MLDVVMLSVIMVSVVMLSVIMVSVVMLSVIMVSVMEPVVIVVKIFSLSLQHDKLERSALVHFKGWSYICGKGLTSQQNTRYGRIIHKNVLGINALAYFGQT